MDECRFRMVLRRPLRPLPNQQAELVQGTGTDTVVGQWQGKPHIPWRAWNAGNTVPGDWHLGDAEIRTGNPRRRLVG